jgi:integrase
MRFLPGQLGTSWESHFGGTMSRSIKSKKLDSRTARRSIPQGKVTHWMPISRGRALGYRRGQRGGTWIGRFDAEDMRREERLGEADDTLDADGVDILDFAQALEKANLFFRDARTQATGEAPRGGPYSVRAAVTDYLKSLEDRQAPDHESATYDLTRNVIPALGAVEVAKLTRPKLEAWRAGLAARPRLSQKKRKKDAKPEPPRALTEDEKRRRRASTNRTFRRLAATLNYALQNGRVNANPMSWKIAPFKNAEVARAAFLTEAQQRVFVTACGDEPDFQKLVLAALHSGCRLGELGRLRVRDVLASSKTLYVEQSKPGASRHVFLDDEGVQFFKRLAADRVPDELLLVRSNGEGWRKDDTKKLMRRACAKGQIPRLGFHQLRHSFSTRLLTQNVQMKIVAQQLGHTSVRMLEKYYGHLIDEHVQQVIGELPSAGLNNAAIVRDGNVVELPVRKEASR